MKYQTLATRRYANAKITGAQNCVGVAKIVQALQNCTNCVILATERTEIVQRIQEMNSNVSDEILQKLKIQIDLDQKNVSELENQNSEFEAIMESINLDLKVWNSFNLGEIQRFLRFQPVRDRVGSIRDGP